jgi:hypothetical protein
LPSLVTPPRTLRIAAPLFAVLCAVLFAPALFAGKAPVFRDLLILVIPLRGYARAALRSGRLPLWTSELFFGAPFLANYQSAVLYPPSAIVYFLPFPLGLSVFLAFHLFVAGVGMSRFLSARLGLGSEASLFGGVVFAFGGFLLSLVPLTNQLEVAAWLPWVLDAGRGIRSERPGRWFVRLTLLLLLQALGGGPEALLLSLGLLLADGVRLSLGRELPLSVSRIGAAACLACALAAFQLAPTLEYVLTTDRATALPASSIFSESLPPISLWQLLVPHRFIEGAPAFIPEGRIPIFWSFYVGIVPLALACIGGVTRNGRFWLAVLACGVALALGDALPVLPALYDLAPRLVGAFRYPAKFFLLSHVAFAVLAAQALERCLVDYSIRRPAALVLVMIVAAEAALGLGAVFEPRIALETLGYPMLAGLSPAALAVLAGGVEASVARGILLSLAMLGALWLLDGRQIRRSLFAALVLGITVLDLLPLHQPSLVFTDWERLRNERALGGGLPPGSRVFHYCTKTPGCVPQGASGIGAWQGTLRPGEDAEANARYVAAALTPDLPILEGIGAVAGTDGLSTRDQREFFRALAVLPRAEGVHLLAALGVERLVGPEPLSSGGLGEPLRADFEGRMLWSYALSDPAPRAYLADRVLKAADVPSALALLASDGFRGGHDAVVIEGSEPRESSAGEGSIESFSYVEGLVRAAVTLIRPGLLIVNNSFFPGWQATVDGEPTALLRANGIVSGVEVPAGSHQIVVRYSPRSFTVGCVISVLAGALLFWIASRAGRTPSARR